MPVKLTQDQMNAMEERLDEIVQWLNIERGHELYEELQHVKELLRRDVTCAAESTSDDDEDAGPAAAHSLCRINRLIHPLGKGAGKAAPAAKRAPAAPAAPKAKKARVAVAQDDSSDDEQLPSSLGRSDHYPQTRNQLAHVLKNAKTQAELKLRDSPDGVVALRGALQLVRKLVKEAVDGLPKQAK